MGIGANIQATRQAAGFTQEQLATEVGVSRQTVTKWEAGETSPDLEHAAALANALGCTVDALTNFDSEGTGLAAPPRGKHLFGSVKVGERGQVVIPKKAREVFGISPGDKLVVLGEDDSGIALCKEDEFMSGVAAVLEAVRKGALFRSASFKPGSPRWPESSRRRSRAWRSAGNRSPSSG